MNWRRIARGNGTMVLADIFILAPLMTLAGSRGAAPTLPILAAILFIELLQPLAVGMMVGRHAPANAPLHGFLAVAPERALVATAMNVLALSIARVRLEVPPTELALTALLMVLVFNGGLGALGGLAGRYLATRSKSAAAESLTETPL